MEDAIELRRLAGLSERPSVIAWLLEKATQIEVKELQAKLSAPASESSSSQTQAAASEAPAATVQTAQTEQASTSTAAAPSAAVAATPLVIAQPPPAAPISSAPAAQRMYFKPITSYGWDQTTTAVKLYFTLAGVEALAPENVVVTFTSSSFSLQVSQLQGSNHSITISLAEDIDPAASSYKARNGKVVATLRKKESKTWSGLTAAEKKKAELSTPKPDESADPNESIMNMMKKLYDEGDDEMKKTISKAWTESREKKGF